MKEETDIALLHFAEYLENQAFQRIVKFIEIKGVVLLVKVDEMYNILKSVPATVQRNSDINVSSKQVLSK